MGKIGDTCITYNCMYNIHIDTEYKEFIPGLLGQLIKVTWLTRGKYICLQSILTHTGNAALFLDLSPSLPGLVLKAMEHQSIALCVSLYSDSFAFSINRTF